MAVQEGGPLADSWHSLSDSQGRYSLSDSRATNSQTHSPHRSPHVSLELSSEARQTLAQYRGAASRGVSSELQDEFRQALLAYRHKSQQDEESAYDLARQQERDEAQAQQQQASAAARQDTKSSREEGAQVGAREGGVSSGWRSRLSFLNPLKLSPFKSKARGETDEEREDREDQERAKKEWEERQMAAAMAKNLPLHLQWLGLEEEGVAHESDGVLADAPDRVATDLSSSDDERRTDSVGPGDRARGGGARGNDTHMARGMQVQRKVEGRLSEGEERRRKDAEMKEAGAMRPTEPGRGQFEREERARRGQGEEEERRRREEEEVEVCVCVAVCWLHCVTLAIVTISSPAPRLSPSMMK